MQISYSEMENKLKEVYKIIYAMEQSIKVANKYERNTEYINVPIDMLKKEINDLSEKINNLKEGMTVTYEEDTSYIDKLINQKKEQEIKMGKGPIDESKVKNGNILKNVVLSKLNKIK
ncbi:hypothetical protein [Clostridium sp.]|uniref:hypothetical protein n=1 Tax=Clostridium sp. TaxID=1506 RepID=UPI002846C183|nr:hypothetical protein [Clostridium sp.]MDR3598861.1 hypothetical protein [Clostridium sp.]